MDQSAHFYISEILYTVSIAPKTVLSVSNQWIKPWKLTKNQTKRTQEGW